MDLKTFQKMNKATVLRLLHNMDLSTSDRQSYKTQVDSMNDGDSGLSSLYDQLRRKAGAIPQTKGA